jgi:tripartite-type tricarboxylate transporter receptor subunit TctC
MKRLLGIAAALALTLALPVVAHAQGFPTKPVRIIVPFPPGGTTDILARDLGQQLGQKWGVPTIVDNKAGASGTIGSEQVVRSAPDGYTLLLTATHHVINPSLRNNLPYDTKRDFTPLALIATSPNVLLATPTFPAQNISDLIRMAKEKPGTLSFASTGIGGANHLAGELFKSMAGVDMVHVPYKGAAPAMNDLLGGQIPLMFDSVPTVLQYVKSGRLKALGVTSLKRVPQLPDVPTIDEAGVKGFEAMAWFGLYGPAGLSPELTKKIAADVGEALRSPELREKFGKLGVDPGMSTQPEFAVFVNAEMDKWALVIKRAKITIN